MRLIELLERVDRSKKNEERYVLDDLAEFWDLYYDDSVDINEAINDFKGYYLGTHICTDTLVGYVVYYWGQKLAGYSFQSGRKSCREYFWVSERVALDLYRLMKSFCPQDDPPSACVLDPDRKMPATYPGDGSSWRLARD